MATPPVALVPAGVWAVASGLGGAGEARAWASAAADAAAWSFRLAECNEREAVAALRVLRAEGRFLAVHGRADWACLAGAEAVIAGHRGLPLPATANRAADHGLLLGCSTHRPAEVAAAAAAGASFAFFGPVWDTPAKHGLLEPRGLDGLRAACAIGLPVIAIGGIGTPEQAIACREAGARGVAVLRAARDPEVLGVLVAALAGAA